MSNAEETMVTIEQAIELANKVLALAKDVSDAGGGHVKLTALQTAFSALDAAEQRMDAAFDAADAREQA